MAVTSVCVGQHPCLLYHVSVARHEISLRATTAADHAVMEGVQEHPNNDNTLVQYTTCAPQLLSLSVLTLFVVYRLCTNNVYTLFVQLL